MIHQYFYGNLYKEALKKAIKSSGDYFNDGILKDKKGVVLFPRHEDVSSIVNFYEWLSMYDIYPDYDDNYACNFIADYNKGAMIYTPFYGDVVQEFYHDFLSNHGFLVLDYFDYF